MSNPHFEAVNSMAEARPKLLFEPRQPLHTAGLVLQCINIYVRDHKQRQVAVAERSVEAHYGAFVVTQTWKGVDEARRWALDVAYGPDGRDARIAGHAARIYELGPQVPADDSDGRSPAVVTWHDGEMHYLIASDQLCRAELVRIADSLYG